MSYNVLCSFTTKRCGLEKEEFVSIQTCRKENGESSGQWVTSICHSSLGCNPQGLIPCAMGRRCRSLQVEQLLIIFLAWRYGIFHSWCRKPALLCTRACCFFGVAKETSLSACSLPWVIGLCSNMCNINGRSVVFNNGL